MSTTPFASTSPFDLISVESWPYPLDPLDLPPPPPLDGRGGDLGGCCDFGVPPALSGLPPTSLVALASAFALTLVFVLFAFVFAFDPGTHTRGASCAAAVSADGTDAFITATLAALPCECAARPPQVSTSLPSGVENAVCDRCRVVDTNEAFVT